MNQPKGSHHTIPNHSKNIFKKIIGSPRMITWISNHLKILFHIAEAKLYVINIWETYFRLPPHRTHERPFGSTITLRMNRFSLEGNMTNKSYQEKNTILEGVKLSQIRGGIKISITILSSDWGMRFTWTK